MAIKVDYVIRETGTNLFRNFTITLASVLTVFVSLILVGSSLLLRQGVEKATKRWEGGIEFIIFIKPDATQEEVAAIQRELDESPEIESVTFVDQEQAYEEFKEMFSQQPELVESVEPSVLPPSFRVVPTDKQANAVEGLSRQFEERPGVEDVASATKVIRQVQELSRRFTFIVVVVAVVLLGAALLLILNTIRMAMYARRHEIEVMKLVGATNWFIRVPFMLEGLVEGMVGAALAIVALVFFSPVIQGWLPPPTEFPLFSGFIPGGAELLGTCILMGITGCVVGALGAGVAVTRFLDV